MKVNSLVYLVLLLLLTACFQAPPQSKPEFLFNDADIDQAALEPSVAAILDANTPNPASNSQIPDIQTLDLQTQSVLAGAKGFLAYIHHNPNATNSKWRIVKHHQDSDSFSTLYGGLRPISSVAVSSDGNTLIFTMQESTDPLSDYEVYKITVNPKKVTRLSNNSSSEHHVSMSSNGQFFVWEGDNPGTAGFRNIFLRNNFTSPATLIGLNPTLAQTQPSISSNGNFIALLRPGSPNRVLIYNRLTNTYTTLRSTSRPLNSPSPSNDGKKVVWLETIGSQYTFFLRNLNTSTTTNLYSSSNLLQHPFLTSDGNFLAFAETHNGVSSIFTRNLSNNQQEQLALNLSPNQHYSPNWQLETSTCTATAQGPYTAMVNTPLYGGARVTSQPGVQVGLLLDPNCPQTVSFSTPLHGTVSNHGQKGFVYTPDFQYIGPDAFSFTLSDGTSATLSINVIEANSSLNGTQYVWYVNNAAASSGNGSAASPFRDIALAEANSNAGDSIYIQTGNTSYIGTVDMKTNQSIIGQGERFVLEGLELATAAAAPIIEASQYGLILGNYSDTSSPNATVGTLSVKGIIIQNISGGPSSSSLGSGILSNNLRGKVIIENVTIKNVSGHAIYLDHNDLDKPEEHDITVRSINIQNPGQHGIWVDDPTHLLIEDGHITGVQKTVAYGGVAIDPQDEFGNYGTGKSITIRNVHISGGANTTGIRIMKNNRYIQNEQTFSKENTLVTIEGNTITVGGRGIFVESYYGTECFTQNGVRKTEIYSGDQGDIVLSGSVSNIVTAAEKYVEKGLTATLINTTTTCGASFSEGVDVGDKIKGTIVVQ